MLMCDTESSGVGIPVYILGFATVLDGMLMSRTRGRKRKMPLFLVSCAVAFLLPFQQQGGGRACFLPKRLP